MTTKELVETGCYGFEGILNFNREQIIGKFITIMEREDRATEKIVSYGLCGMSGLYVFGSILRVLI